MAITNITKEGKFIIFQTAEKETPIKFDCKDLVLISFTGRAVKTVPNIMRDCPTHTQALVMTAVINYVRYVHKVQMWSAERAKDTINRYEPFIPYLDRVESFPTQCPKGYIKWVLDNDLRFSESSLRRFRAESKLHEQIKQFSEVDKQTIQILANHYSNDSDTMNMLLGLPIEHTKIMLKLFRVTVKDGICWNLDYDFRNFLDNIRQSCYSSFPNDWEQFVDTNRSFEYNRKNLEMLKRRERERKIISQEDKIRAITELSNETYTIIVPENLEQFTDEGNQQNNCVGHYYHESIADGVNLIYFIRMTASPEKSYTTCRYNIRSAETVEHRTKNNHWQDNTAVCALIKAVDEKIKELLAE